MLKAGSVITINSKINGKIVKNENTFTTKPLSLDDKLDLIAKMVLSGNVQMYNFNPFNFEFGQSNVVELKSNGENKIKELSTNLNLNLSTSITQLQENQTIQLCTPNYITTKTYGS